MTELGTNATRGRASAHRSPKAPSARSQTFQRLWMVLRQPSAASTTRRRADVTGMLMLAASTVALASILLTKLVGGPGLYNTPLAVVMCVLAIGLSGLMLRWRNRHLPALLFPTYYLIATALVVAGTTLSDEPVAGLGTASLLAFVSMGVFFCCSWLVAIVIELAMLVSITVVFVHIHIDLPDAFVLQGTVLCMGLFIGWLARAATAAELDPLTGLLNGGGFDRALNEGTAFGRRTSAPVSLMMLDIDNFRALNESKGRSAGDAALRNAAHRWRAFLGHGISVETLSRMGNDTFALVLRGYTAELAATLADRMRAAVAPELTISAGVGELAEGESASMLQGRVQIALYEAQAHGGDQTIQHGLQDRAAASSIEVALREGQFQVYYQPIVDLATGKVTGDEALVRWQDPQRGLVGPDDFIPLAERSGAIVALGAWILNQACAQTAEFIRGNGYLRRVSVNASGHELREGTYVETVRRVLESTGLDPAALIIEVTESTFDADHPQVIAELHGLRALGVDISIDDFGTGYSSLSRLHTLPATAVKIDQSFVREISANGEPTPVLRAIAGIAKALDLKTVAEGVEHASQARALLELGCTYGQGYYWGRPAPQQQIHTLPELAARINTGAAYTPQFSGRGTAPTGPAAHAAREDQPGSAEDFDTARAQSPESTNLPERNRYLPSHYSVNTDPQRQSTPPPPQ